jgi:tetratricopeptide (TPR) repeat protein
MGKSIQGAGGALALGVVFKSILSRARLFSTKETVFPERWLKVAFQELQSVFESFDGSMMISVVMGLIDNDKGFLYYINAEHPFCVLYRDNKASFIEKELNLRKIGIMTAEHSGDFQVNTFKLEDSDVIILGSDGRDDIKLGLDEQGGRVINEDENLFLETVESAEADLEKIFTITQKKGELIDDYSLLRIEYKNPYPLVEYTEEEVKAEELYKSGKYLEAEAIIEELVEAGKASKSIYKIRAHIPFQREMYNKAADLMAEYLDLFPEDNSILLQTANSYKLSNRLELAAVCNKIELSSGNKSRYSAIKSAALLYISLWNGICTLIL